MTEAWIAIGSLLPGICVSIFFFYFQRRQNRRDKKVDERAEIRKRESILSLELQMAIAKMAYASAMALKRGAPNGEVEKGIEEYNKAKTEYYKFMNEQGYAHTLEQ